MNSLHLSLYDFQKHCLLSSAEYNLIQVKFMDDYHFSSLQMLQILMQNQIFWLLFFWEDPLNTVIHVLLAYTSEQLL